MIKAFFELEIIQVLLVLGIPTVGLVLGLLSLTGRCHEIFSIIFFIEMSTLFCAVLPHREEEKIIPKTPCWKTPPRDRLRAD